MSSYYFIGSIGDGEAYNDKIVKNTIENIVKKEEKIINDYKLLKDFKQVFPDQNSDDLNKHLEERRMFISYKLQSQRDQCSALYKLLEYLNALEAKNNSLLQEKERDSNMIMQKINSLEDSINPLSLLIEN